MGTAMSPSMYSSQTTMVKAALVPWGIKVATSTAQEGGKNQKVSEKTLSIQKSCHKIKLLSIVPFIQGQSRPLSRIMSLGDSV